MLNEDILLILIFIMVGLTALYSSISDTTKSKRAIRKFTNIAFDIISNHIAILDKSGKKYDTFDSYLDTLIPSVTKELKEAINNSDMINPKIKRFITDEIINDFINSTVDLYREELELAFKQLKEDNQ